MNSVLSKDFDYFDLCLQISKTDKRVITANVKTYENAGSYITVKTFKRDNACDECHLNQKLTLTLFELGHLTSSFEKIQILSVNAFRETEKETDSATRKRTPERTLKKNIASKKTRTEYDKTESDPGN